MGTSADAFSQQRATGVADILSRMRADQNHSAPPGAPPVSRRWSRAIFPLALLLSVLLHVALFVALPLWREPPTEPPEARATLKLSLWEPIPEPVVEDPPQVDEPEERQEERQEEWIEELHLPRHTAETLDLEGTDFDAPETDQRVAGDPAHGPGLPADTAEAADQQKTEELDDAGELAFSSEPELAERVPGGMQPMDEQSMGQAAVTDPRSEVDARRMEMVNRYLARMAGQVRERWQMPASAGADHRGVIRMRVDENGYLVSARLHRPSGHPDLDNSVLAAINAVPRYEVPESPEIVRRYYSNLRFEYSGAQ